MNLRDKLKEKTIILSIQPFTQADASQYCKIISVIQKWEKDDALTGVLN